MKQSTGCAEENKITCRLSFVNEEEAVLSLSEEENEEMRFFVYPMGDGEAEVTAQDVGLLAKIQKREITQEKVISKMIKCIIKGLQTLEKSGYPTVVFVEKKGSTFEEILHSTDVVQKEYSEYMMKSPEKRQRTTSSCAETTEKMVCEETEEGYECRNEDRSFFARVNPYRDGWYIYEVEVLYDKRRTGIATACMRALMERFPQLYLQVGSYNEAAMGLYEKLGFEVLEELCYYA